jgi:hypothetical protein
MVSPLAARVGCAPDILFPVSGCTPARATLARRWGQGKSLTPDERAAFKRFMLDLRDREFNGNTQRMAKRLDYSQGALYSFFSKDLNGGVRLLSRVSDFTGASFDEMLGRVPSGKGARKLGREADRYPNRGEAIAIAKRLGYRADAIAHVRELTLRRGVADLPTRKWLDWIRLRDEALSDPHASDVEQPANTDDEANG